jgi:hypothetical protein
MELQSRVSRHGILVIYSVFAEPTSLGPTRTTSPRFPLAEALNEPARLRTELIMQPEQHICHGLLLHHFNVCLPPGRRLSSKGTRIGPQWVEKHIIEEAKDFGTKPRQKKRPQDSGQLEFHNVQVVALTNRMQKKFTNFTARGRRLAKGFCTVRGWPVPLRQGFAGVCRREATDKLSTLHSYIEPRLGKSPGLSAGGRRD